MTGHFTTLDKCERWDHIADPSKFMRVPFSFRTEYSNDSAFALQGQTYAYRVYKLESIDYARGLAEYLEVYNG